MNTALRIWLAVAGLSGLAAVVLGALGAHAIKDAGAEVAARLATAQRYHLFHTLALLAVILLAQGGDSGALRVSRWTWLAGMLLFSGSLYAASFAPGLSTRFAPAGGVLLMLGWLGLCLHALRAG